MNISGAEATVLLAAMRQAKTDAASVDQETKRKIDLVFGTNLSSPGGVVGGPGTELHKILKRYFGADAIPGCRCGERMDKMDLWGPAGCREHLEEIVGWLLEAARKRAEAYRQQQERMAAPGYDAAADTAPKLPRSAVLWAKVARMPGAKTFLRRMVHRAIRRAERISEGAMPTTTAGRRDL